MSPLEDFLVKKEIAKEPSEGTPIVSHGDPTIQRALSLVNQQLNPVMPVDFNTAMRLYNENDLPGDPNNKDKKTRLSGFRLKIDNPNLYVNTDSERYKKATNEKDRVANLMLASTLIHEQIHGTERGTVGEGAAIRKQADWLESQLPTLNSYERARLEPFINKLNDWNLTERIRLRREARKKK